MTHASVPKDQREVLGIGDNFVRISIGLENAEDLITDINQALINAVDYFLLFFYFLKLIFIFSIFKIPTA